jgi:hypothetical protein
VLSQPPDLSKTPIRGVPKNRGTRFPCQLKFIAVKIFKKEDCNCSKRKDYLNNLFLPQEEKTITLK